MNPVAKPNLSIEQTNQLDKTISQEAYKEAIHSQTTPEQKERVREAMLKYCEQDTVAMVKIVHAWNA